MPKVLASEIIGNTGMGFVASMFGFTHDDQFAAFVNDIIEEQAAVLEGRIGPAAYASVTTPAFVHAKRAEKALVAAELIDRRINIRLADVQAAGEDFSTAAEEKKRDKYLREAEDLIFRLSAGDLAVGYAESSHFGETDA